MTVLGALPNAPLACVLLAIEYEEVPDFTTRMGSIKPELLKKLPRSREAVDVLLVPTLVPGQPRPLAVHEFLSESMQHSLKISPLQLSLSVTTYRRAADLIDLFASLLDIVWPSLDPLVTRIGVRYIDFLLPKPHETLEAYVQSSIHGIQDLQLGQLDTLSAHITQYQFAEGAMSIRYATCTGTPQIPPEIGLGNMKPSDIMTQTHHGKAAILDVDRFTNISQRLSQQDTLALVTRFQQDQSQAFKAIITQYAVDTWGA